MQVIPKNLQKQYIMNICCNVSSMDVHSSYIIVIAAFTFVLFFCKQLAECINACLLTMQMCTNNSCICPETLSCCDCNLTYSKQEILYIICVSTTVLFSLSQPLFLLGVELMSSSVFADKTYFSVNILTISFDANSIQHKHIAKRSENASILAQNMPTEFNKSLLLANTSVTQNCIDVCAHQKEIDVLYLITPAALLSTLTTSTWLQLQKDGHFTQDPDWNYEIFQSLPMQVYEIFYSLEIFAITSVLVFASSDPAILQTSLAQSCCISALLIYFCVFSRSKNREDEQTVNMFIFAFVCSLLSFLLAMNINKCLVTIFSNVVTCIFVVSVAFLHMTVNDSTKCGTIILFRTVSTNFTLLYFYCMLLMDANKFCM